MLILQHPRFADRPFNGTEMEFLSSNLSKIGWTIKEEINIPTPPTPS